MTHSGFYITIASDTSYNELIAEIYINGDFIALLNQDAGPDHIKIEFPASVNDATEQNSIDLDVFLVAVQEAKKQLVGHTWKT